MWLLLYADDGLATAGGPWFERPLLFHLFLLMVLGTPLKWPKVRGGVQLEWVGYWIDFAWFEMGVSAKRAAWAAAWLSDKVRERRVPLGELKEGLGRLVFVTGPLDHLRPLLGPLFAWAANGARFARPKLPVMVLLLMEYLAEELRTSHATGCREPPKELGELFRLDAKAEGDDVAVGGWLSRDGTPTKEAPWFALRLTRKTAPWAFARGETFRVIASLELLGVLLGVMLLLPVADFTRPAGSTGVVTFACGTDNRGNSFLLDRMLTTKYPLGLILIELSHQLRLRNAALQARWIPRLQNEEADALTNWDFRHFDKKLRIVVPDEDLSSLDFGILPRLLATGEAYLAELSVAKEQAKAESAAGWTYRKKRAGEALKDRQPW